MKRRLFDASVPPESANPLPADTLKENATLTKAARKRIAPMTMMGRQFLPEFLGFETLDSSTGFTAGGSVDSVVFLRI